MTKEVTNNDRIFTKIRYSIDVPSPSFLSVSSFSRRHYRGVLTLEKLETEG